MNKQETIADIIAWLRRPREGENAYLTVWRDEIADLLEAAHKREAQSIERKPNTDWKDICAKCKDGDIEPKHCEYYGEPNGCNSPIYGEHPTAEKSSIVGDAAAMREALKAARVAIEAAKKKMGVDNPVILEIIDAALAEPPRNCDVGTAEEQEVRFRNYCWNHSSRDKNMECQCPIDAEGKAGCKLTWAQMPYEAKEAINER